MKKTAILLCSLACIFLSSCTSVPENTTAAIAEVSTEEGEAQDLSNSPKLIASLEAFKGAELVPKQILRTIPIMNIEPDKAMDTIGRLIPNILIAKNEDPDYLIIRGEESAVKDAEKLITSVDVRSGQILIEGTVIEVSDSGLNDLGIIWGSQKGEFKFSVDSSGVVRLKDDTEVIIKALLASGKARVLANPRITALDGKLAVINIGSRIPYSVPANTSATSSQWTVQYIDAGVNLKIRPSVTNDRYIVSEIVPEVSSISEWRQTMAGEFPVISTRNASVTVRLKEGQTLAIGGLISDSERTNTLRVPFVSDIPIVGELFKRNITESSRSDIVFLITPHIVE